MTAGQKKCKAQRALQRYGAENFDILDLHRCLQEFFNLLFFFLNTVNGGKCMVSKPLERGSAWTYIMCEFPSFQHFKSELIAQNKGFQENDKPEHIILYLVQTGYIFCLLFVEK